MWNDVHADVPCTSSARIWSSLKVAAESYYVGRALRLRMHSITALVMLILVVMLIFGVEASAEGQLARRR